jgi:hypothetical protein
MAKTTQLFFDNQWLPVAEGYEAFKSAKAEGFPIRVLHPSGSFKVIHNSEALPEGEPDRYVAEA